MSKPTIHHAVQKKAKANGINITAIDGGFRAEVVAKPEDFVSGPVPKDLVDQLIAKMPPKPKKARKAKKDKAAKAAVPANKSVVKKSYKDVYKAKGSGQGCGDALDRALKDALDGDCSLPKIAKENAVPFLWQVLNPGLQRMNLSNVLRAKLKRGEKVSVEGKNIRL